MVLSKKKFHIKNIAVHVCDESLFRSRRVALFWVVPVRDGGRETLGEKKAVYR